jgi:hypothetical protein
MASCRLARWAYAEETLAALPARLSVDQCHARVVLEVHHPVVMAALANTPRAAKSRGFFAASTTPFRET